MKPKDAGGARAGSEGRWSEYYGRDVEISLREGAKDS